MDYLECSCKGENPNCFKCDGTGLVASAKEQIGRPPVQLGKSQPSDSEQNSPRPIREQIKAKGTFLTDEDIESIARSAYLRKREKIQKRKAKELEKKLALEKLAPVDVAYVKKSIDSNGSSSRLIQAVEIKVVAKKSKAALVSCPFCDAKVKDLDKHFKNLHTPEGRERKERLKELKKTKALERRKNLDSQTNKRKTPPDLVKVKKAFGEYKKLHPQARICGFCKGLFEDVFTLRKHIGQLHPQAGNIEPLQPLGKKKVHIVPNSGKHNPGSTKPVRQEENHKQEDPNAERKMDATYGLGGFARDGGKFGSPSLYDSMDDESFS